jgi:hypothetical protein
MLTILLSMGASWRRSSACSGRPNAICLATARLASNMNWGSAPGTWDWEIVNRPLQQECLPPCVDMNRNPPAAHVRRARC